ncbi:MAG: TIGR01212 family radical SAM protein, partial [Eubacterium sp.]
CPNRDGTFGSGGCIYCGAKGGGNETLSEALSVREQIEKNKAYIKKRYKATQFIPYFQSFTNTYCDFETFKIYIEDAAYSLEDTVGIAISTRPDCITEEQLSFLEKIQEERKIDISIELGLQTANDETLKIINRGHGSKAYVEAAKSIKKHHLQLCTHVILDLPWDNLEDVVKTARMISKAESDFVKCHALYVEKNTVLGEWYLNGSISLFPKEEYIKRCILFLEHLEPNMVVQRIIGRAPEAESIMTNWNTSWWKIRDLLETQMEEENHFQGKNYQK